MVKRNSPKQIIAQILNNLPAAIKVGRKDRENNQTMTSTLIIMGVNQ